ncbi:hypothetical protein FDP25_03695 [Roseovarius sp. A21]|uniref:Uncharacterized protein n=1 Tax=Roseovarius bejariae TaxID=2576383 RepID=A0A844CV19_9RHOB|nr:hypothetical protein [Roseovarius bejariae]MRU14530.1 hypothetical protein [Roseovarius bejariae]
MLFRLAPLALSLLPALAQAESLGIRFNEISPGTEFYYEGHGKLGVDKMDRYVGVRNGKHEFQSFFPRQGSYGKLFRISRYDSQGRLVEIEKIGVGTLTRFVPFHCDRSGQCKCTHERIVINPKRGTRKSTRKHFEIRKSGRKLNIISNANTNRLESSITLGDHNIVVKNTEATGNEKGGSKLVEIHKP